MSTQPQHVCKVPENGKPSELWMCPTCQNWWFALTDANGKVRDWARTARR